MVSINKPGKIPLFDKIGYGTGNFGFGIVFQIIATYFVFYSTAILKIPGTIIGTAVSLSVIWDAVTDPMMGYISDRTGFRHFGRRHFYILFGTVALSLTNFFLWDLDPGFSLPVKTALVLILLLLIKTFMTIYTVPYTALGAELTSDYDERSSIQGIRTIFFLLGLSIATVMGMYLFFGPTPEYPQGQLNPAAYRNLGLTSSLMALAFGLYCYFTTKKYIPYLPGIDSDGARPDFRIARLVEDILEAMKNRDYKYVVLGYMFTNTATALIGSVGLHVFTYTFLFDNTAIAFIIGVQFGISIISQPLWVMISKRIDKKPAIVLGLSLSLAAGLYFLALVLLRDITTGNVFYFLPYSILAGFGSAVLFSLPLSMIADTIDVQELATGERNEGVFYGCQTLFYKLAQSLAILILGFILDLINFDSELIHQPVGTVITLGMVLAIGCIICFVLAVASYSRYSLDKTKVDMVQQQIKNNIEK